MNIGIVVEDDRDGEAYSALIKKIRDDISEVVLFPCGGSGTLKSRFVSGLKRFKWYAPNTPYAIDKALIIVDSDCSDASTWEDLLEETFERSHFDPGFPVHFHATKCELESWLLVDEEALNQVSHHRGKNKRLRPANIEFESYRNAKELFQRRLSEAGLPATPPVYKEIAGFADLERIASRCPHFSQFTSKVRAC